MQLPGHTTEMLNQDEGEVEESVFLKNFIYLFLERGKGKEKERERNINVWLSLVHPLPGNSAHNPGMCPDWELNL